MLLPYYRDSRIFQDIDKCMRHYQLSLDSFGAWLLPGREIRARQLHDAVQNVSDGGDKCGDAL